MGSFLAMKFVSLVFIFALICASQQGQVCDAVLYVANACMNGHNVPANVQSAVTSGITSALGAFRRRLGIYDQALNAGCTAAYNAAAGAAGVPPAVATCFRNDIVNACVAKIHELGGRRLAKCGKKCMKKKMAKAKKGKGKKRELGKKEGKGKKGKKSRKLGKKGKKAGKKGKKGRKLAKKSKGKKGKKSRKLGKKG